MHLDNLYALLGNSPSASSIKTFLSELSGSSPTPTPEVKAYPDVVYHNYYDLGISLCYVPTKGTKIPVNAQPGDLKLDTIDIYHNPASETAPIRPGRVPKPTFKTFSALPIEFPHVPVASSSSTGESSTTEPATSQSNLLLDGSSVGKDLVKALGEPSKKGGGQFWLDVYLEWPALGVQIDLKEQGKEITEEQKKKGMGGVWDKAAEWGWSCLKVFEKAG